MPNTKELVLELEWTSLLDGKKQNIQLYLLDLQRLVQGHSSVPFNKLGFDLLKCPPTKEFSLVRRIHFKPDPIDDYPLQGSTRVDNVEPCTLYLNTSLTRYLRPLSSDWDIYYDNKLICFQLIEEQLCLNVHWYHVINHFTMRGGSLIRHNLDWEPFSLQ